MIDKRFNEFVQRNLLVDFATGSNCEFKCRERVTHRPTTQFDDTINSIFTDHEFCVGDYPVDVIFQFLHRQKMKLQMLRATANRLTDFLRVGSRQHEHNMLWGLFESFQQCCFSRFREHVNFVENKNTMPTRISECCTFN